MQKEPVEKINFLSNHNIFYLKGDIPLYLLHERLIIRIEYILDLQTYIPKIIDKTHDKTHDKSDNKFQGLISYKNDYMDNDYINKNENDYINIICKEYHGHIVIPYEEVIPVENTFKKFLYTYHFEYKNICFTINNITYQYDKNNKIIRIV